METQAEWDILPQFVASPSNVTDSCPAESSYC